MSDVDTSGVSEKPCPLDPELYAREDVRRVLAVLDIGALYRILQDAKVSQRQIAALTGQSQSETSSMQARTRLHPLIAALESRPGGDAKQLAQMARQVATTRV
ncbi:MAG: hypothetical protein ACRDTG_08905 [Pseudonocardiaceae bacterium]